MGPENDGDDWRHDTVERLPRVPAEEPAPSFTESLFAGAATPSVEEEHPRADRSLLVILGSVALALALSIGALLLFTGGPDGAGGGDQVAVGGTAGGSAPAGAGSADAPPESGSGSPSESPSKSPRPTGPSVDLRDVTVASAPVTAPSGTDVDGNPVTYDAGNMVDGNRQTAWRMPGDGSGQVITLDLPEAAALTRVGVVNGYAKAGRDRQILNWYEGNRRLLQVRWTFDDGSSAVQDLEETMRFQWLPLDGVVTRQVRLELLEVSAPGAGPEGRDFTAISEVVLFGRAG